MKRERVKVRVREKVRRMPSRMPRMRIQYVKPDPNKPHRVQVLISPTPAHMHETIVRLEGGPPVEPRVAGMVRHYTSKITGRFVVRPGHMIARMFLNVRDLRHNGAEIMSHECGHAAMAWARLRNANLKRMVGEEVMCYALGRMMQQVNHISYVMRIFA